MVQFSGVRSIVKITFTPESPLEGKFVDKYVVVYKGAINSNESQTDPDDDGQALATTPFYCGELRILGDTPYASSWDCVCEGGHPGSMNCGHLSYVVFIWHI